MSDAIPQLTLQTIQVLSALFSNLQSELSGSQIRQFAKLRSGTLYPILIRLERAGLLTSRWELEDPKILRRPRRRYYRLTPLGAEEFKSAMGKMKLAFNHLK